MEHKMKNHAKQVSQSIENATTIIETLSLAADGPTQIEPDLIDRVTRAVLAELKRAQEVLEAMEQGSAQTAIHAVS
jgi:hypothetical protein